MSFEMPEIKRTTYNYDLASVEKDMLVGNINRMFVTKSETELSNSCNWAIRRILNILDMQNKRLEEQREL